MKGKRADSIEKEHFQKRITQKIIKSFIVLIIIILFCFIFITKHKTKSINYKEAGNVDYNISLSQNDFFESDTLPANNQYISSLINAININFKYNLQMNDMYSNYKYKFRIDARN